LIRPPAAWTLALARDAAALQPYRLTLSDLQEFGTPPHDIATQMNETLAERQLFSAVPEDDARIRRMFDAAEIAPKFALKLADADGRTGALARSIARNDGPRSARSRADVPDWHPRRSESALPGDVLGLHRLAQFATRLTDQAPPQLATQPICNGLRLRHSRRSHDPTLNLRRLF
jgi:hypothetical protein